MDFLDVSFSDRNQILFEEDEYDGPPGSSKLQKSCSAFFEENVCLVTCLRFIPNSLRQGVPSNCSKAIACIKLCGTAKRTCLPACSSVDPASFFDNKSIFVFANSATHLLHEAWVLIPDDLPIDVAQLCLRLLCNHFKCQKFENYFIYSFL